MKFFRMEMDGVKMVSTIVFILKAYTDGSVFGESLDSATIDRI